MGEKSKIKCAPPHQRQSWGAWPYGAGRRSRRHVNANNFRKAFGLAAWGQLHSCRGRQCQSRLNISPGGGAERAVGGGRGGPLPLWPDGGVVVGVVRRERRRTASRPGKEKEQVSQALTSKFPHSTLLRAFCVSLVEYKTSVSGMNNHRNFLRVGEEERGQTP